MRNEKCGLAERMADYRSSPVAGSMMLPYLAWVSFAAVLNFTSWRMKSKAMAASWQDTIQRLAVTSSSSHHRPYIRFVKRLFAAIDAARESPMSRALLVIDVQNEYFTGALPITYPVGHLEQILAAMDAADGRVPVIVVQHHFLDPAMPFFQKGTAGWELHSEVKKRPHELLVEKTMPGSFTGTLLESWLKENGVDTVTIAGYMTHMCCDTTARQAVHLGLKVEFLRDATGTLALSNAAGDVKAEELHRSILCAQQMLLSEVLDVSTWIKRL